MKAGLTQEQMAERCEISTSFLSHIERGTRKLSLETAVKIADYLHVSMNSLIMKTKGNLIKKIKDRKRLVYGLSEWLRGWDLNHTTSGL